MKNIKLEINGKPVTVKEGTTILKAAQKVNIKVPVLCYHPDLPAWAACGLCVVKLAGTAKMLRACSTPVEEGMKIVTHDPEIVQVRRTVIELILSTHPNDCLQCPRNQNCELQRLAADFGIRELPFEHRLHHQPVDATTGSIVLNPEKCILCGRCAKVCQQMQNVWALEFLGRGEKTRIAPAADVTLAESPCIKCGQCSAHCPVGAIYEKDETRDVLKALLNPDLHCVVQIAPAVRVAIGEAFGFEPGTLLTGKTYAALRQMGFKAIFDTNFGADLTIIEEATEFLSRVKNGGPLPLITSCSPGWVNFLEKFYPEMIPHTSTCKSPMSMLSTLAKTHYAEKKGLRPDQIYMVGIMPCVAKKFEAARPEHAMADGTPYTDAVLTTRELAWMIKSYGIDFVNLPDGEFDRPLGISSGAADIFGATGGVMEAALRTAAVKLTGQELGPLVFEDVRGVTGLKEATIRVAGIDVNIAVSNGLTNAKEILEKVKNGEKQYHLIEIMACPGGCVAGGGQPYPPMDMDVLDPSLPLLRAKALYKIDSDKQLRRSHENPAIEHLYQEFLGEPNGEKAHHLLHTHYHASMPRGIR